MIFLNRADIYKVLFVVLGLSILWLGISTVGALNSINQVSRNTEVIYSKECETTKSQVVEQLQKKYYENSAEYEDLAKKAQEIKLRLRKLEVSFN